MEKELVQQYINDGLEAKPSTAYERQILLDIERYMETVTVKIGDETVLDGFLERDENLKQFRAKVKGQTPGGFEAESLKYCIFREFYLAFCENDAKYRTEVKELAKNTKLIVAAVAGGIATSVGLAVAVVSALAAAALWLILKVGMSVFCQRYASLFRAN